MKEDKLGDLSMELSVDVLNLCKKLKAKKETVPLGKTRSIRFDKINYLIR